MTTDKDALSRSGMALLTIVALVSVAAFGALPSSPSGPMSAASMHTTENDGDRTLDEAVEAWNFTGFHGTWNATFPDATWISLAWPVGETWEVGDLTVTITVVYNNRVPEDDVQVPYCDFVGPRDDAFPRLGACFGGTGQWADGAMETTASYDGMTVDAAAPDPFLVPPTTCTPLFCYNEPARIRLTSTPGLADPRPQHQPVLHMVLATAGPAVEEVAINVTWQDTVLAHDRGPAEDSFMYFREDFDNDVWVRSDQPGRAWTPYYQENGTLAVPLGVEDRGLVLHWFPQPYDDVTNTLYDAWYERPDGRRVDHLFTGEMTDDSGTWRFYIEKAREADPDDWPRYVDEPVLWGTLFDWAKLPWQE